MISIMAAAEQDDSIRRIGLSMKLRIRGGSSILFPRIASTESTNLAGCAVDRQHIG
jgi:hypothetical protein